ncbi:oxidoreductase [Tenacibaculum sp. E3R01]|uniref:WD40/YVTN/BNR-like repeat-containing protein n=1 Tax=Tenacibaculum sp. E3R01 TaxID=2267227 RepID=UPI000DEB4707|nr:sialidase family protein [Tenacibaculum sp. E3R01]RBW63162.1 oxidoreductase [Tenacibaculum sp. E3R01]
MKRIELFFLVAIIFISCKKEYQPRNINSADITTFKIDSSSIRAIKAIDNNNVIFADSKGNIGKTEDGGKNWNFNKVIYNDSITPHFRSIAVNKENIFALSIANPALLYKIDANETKIVYKEEHPKVFYDALQFFPDGKNGIAVGDPTENCPSIIITSNGGTTWNKIPCSKLPVFEDGEAFFAASNTNIKIVNNTVWIVSGGKKARVLKSTDKGNTWNIYDTPIVQGNGPQGMYSVDFYDELHGITIGGDYSNSNDNCANKAITSDGGKTWTLVADNQEPNYKSCIQYVPNSKGKEIIAVGKTGISFSNDGGLNWKKLSDESFYAIQFVNQNTAWLSGHEKMGKLILK